MEMGEIAYKVYRALSYGISPLIRLNLVWRKFRGREHPVRWRERLGCPSAVRPDGPLIWFHAVSLGEGLSAIPIINCCLERMPHFTVLMTTSTASGFEVIKNRLPDNVIYQFAPVDIPSSMDAFLHHWRPNVIMLIESELWPNLIIGAARTGVALVLLNGRISAKSLKYWSLPVVFPLITLMLSKFSLILPLSSLQGIHFQLLQAPPSIINYSGDLKCAIDDFDICEGDNKSLQEFQTQLFHRKVWMAASIHEEEEEVFVEAHNQLKLKHPDILTIIAPRKPHHGRILALKLRKEGFGVALRSCCDKITPGTDIYVVDSLGELRKLYRLSPIAVIGGSFLKGLAGHNILEAAAAGCAVFTGCYVGHFSHMLLEMQRVNSLSVQQIAAEKLEVTLDEVFHNVEAIEERQAAAKQAYCNLSRGVVERFWAVLQFQIFENIASQGTEHCDGQNLKIRKKLLRK